MRLLDFIVKELLQIRRDKRMASSLFIWPIMQLLLFGYALNTDVKHIGIAVCDQDRTPSSRELIRQLTSSEYLDFVGPVSNPADANSILVGGKADAVVIIPVEFEQHIRAGDTTQVQALLDGSNPNTGTIAAGYMGSIVQTYGAQLLSTRFSRADQRAMSSAGIDVRMRVWYNPALETKYTMVPGVICTVVGMMTMMLAASTIVKEREDGTIEQLIVTPVKKWEIIVGKSLPILIIGYIEVTTVLLAGVLIFNVPVRGSVLLLMAVACPFLTASLAMGLVVSTISKTQYQASMTMAFFSLPNMMLSGFMFPISSMPPALQTATRIIPMRYFLVVVRDILLKGSGISLLWDQVIPLIMLATSFILMAAWQFKKKLD